MYLAITGIATMTNQSRTEKRKAQTDSSKMYTGKSLNWKWRGAGKQN